MVHRELIHQFREHVRQAERHVERQREIVRSARRFDDATAELAEDVLRTFEWTLAEHQRHLQAAEREESEARLVGG